jgi:hypothetical protein
MSRPRFSVVIPTRERAGTLPFTLRTCLEQPYDDYEIVVCDNCGSPPTRQVVDRFASKRIKYVRAERPLAMSANWELAISQAAGEYVTVIGDDDALLPHALPELDRLTRSLHVRAIRWSGVYYSWPDVALAGEGDYLRIPLGRGQRLVDGREAIASVMRFQSCYSSLPMLYNSVVHRDLIDEVRRRGGRVFGNPIPDVYSGIALAYVAGTYASLDTPMTVAGTSGRSYGVAVICFPGRSPLDGEFRRLNAEARLGTHRWVPDLPIFPAVYVADSFQQAKEALFPSDDGLQMDRKLVAVQCVGALQADGPEQWRAALRVIRDTFADAPDLQTWFDANLADAPFAQRPALKLRNSYLGFDGMFLHLNADEFGVRDVYAAAQLCDRILNYSAGPIEYGLRPQAPQRPTSGEGRPRRSNPVIETPVATRSDGVLTAVRKWFRGFGGRRKRDAA